MYLYYEEHRILSTLIDAFNFAKTDFWYQLQHFQNILNTRFYKLLKSLLILRTHLCCKYCNVQHFLSLCIIALGSEGIQSNGWDESLQ